MAHDISGTIREVAQVTSLLKQGKLISAAQRTRKGVQVLLSPSLLRAEQEELARHIATAAMSLSGHPDIRRIFPLAIDHVPGKEQELLHILNQLVEALDAESADQSREAARAMEERKQAALEEAERLLAAGAQEEARKILARIRREYPHDALLSVAAADCFLRHKLYEDALEPLETAVGLMPENTSAQVHNRLGMLYRRKKNYSSALRHFEKALSVEDNDPHLHFNAGRVFIDMGEWKKAHEAARQALSLHSDFPEAEQMAAYAAARLSR